MKRAPLNMRTSPALRAKIEAAAAINYRSLTQEVEFRLERSFHEDWIVAQLKLAPTSPPSRQGEGV